MGRYGHRDHGVGESAGGNSQTCKFEIEFKCNLKLLLVFKDENLPEELATLDLGLLVATIREDINYKGTLDPKDSFRNSMIQLF